MTKCWLCSQEVSEKARNYKHHCKLFVLFKLGYDNWEPTVEVKVPVLGNYLVPKKMTFDQFRKKILILVGHSEEWYDFDGCLQVDAKSISYSKLGQQGFEDVYTRCLHYIADHLLKCGRDDLHDMVMMEF